LVSTSEDAVGDAPILTHVTVRVPVARERVQCLLATAFEGVREPLTDEGVRLRDALEDRVHILNHAAVIRGLEVLAQKYPERMAEIINDEDDAETADVFLQVCLFGEILYG
jgi:hypothetical protein